MRYNVQMLEEGISFFKSIPLDLVVFGGIIIVIALDGLRSGLGRALAISLALPLSLLMYSLVGKAIVISTLTFLFATPTAEAITFGVIVILMYLLLRRMGFNYIDSGVGEPIQSLLAGAAVAVIFAIVWLQLPILDTFWNFGNNVKAVFSDDFKLWWLLGAYVGLAFARG